MPRPVPSAGALRAAAGVAFTFLGAAWGQGSGVINLDMYRAINSKDISLQLENVELASIPGVLSYLLTEAVGEHFPQDTIPGKPGPTTKPAKAKPGAGLSDGDYSGEGGFVPLSAEPEDGEVLGAAELLDANAVFGYEEDPDEVDAIALAAGVGTVTLEDDSLGADPDADLGADPDAEPEPAAPSAAGGAAAAAGEEPVDDDVAGTRRRRTRTERHKGIDVVFRTDFKVKNPPALLSSKQVAFVDFGPDVQFENGEAQGKGYKWDYGAFVGAEKHVDKRTPQMLPGYWFSVAGACPNLPFNQKGTAPNKLNPECMVHPSGVGKLQSSLCPNGGTSGGAIPTGELDCIYGYRAPAVGTPDVLKLDDLSGITKEDCGGRLCRDWLDFRTSCSNDTYKQIFNYGRRRVVAKTKYCIEYDIHPACQDSCFSKECMSLKETEKEVGLPFWRGRCSSGANLVRAEQLAGAFGIPGAQDDHQQTSLLVRDAPETCLRPNQTKVCHPDPATGFMYCTRLWSGVCQSCYIPGTVRPLPDASKHIMCPWTVLQESDYTDALAPECKTSAPSDLCCLYASSCNISIPADGITAASVMPLDEEGYAAMTSLRSTQGMKNFLYRYHNELFGGELVDDEGLGNFAYWEWGSFPQVGHSFARAVKGSRPFFVYPTTSTTSTTLTRTGTTVKAVVSAPDADEPEAVTDSGEEPEQPSKGGGGTPPWVWAVVGVGVAGVAAAGAAAFFLLRRGGGGSREPRGRQYRGDDVEDSPERPARRREPSASRGNNGGGARRTRGAGVEPNEEDPQSAAPTAPLVGGSRGGVVLAPAGTAFQRPAVAPPYQQLVPAGGPPIGQPMALPAGSLVPGAPRLVVPGTYTTSPVPVYQGYRPIG